MTEVIAFFAGALFVLLWQWFLRLAAALGKRAAELENKR